MTYSMKPPGCDPARIKGMSERLIVSHYENNYGGAVKRLNLIEEKLAELDYASAPVFVVNGFKREQLIAINSMILHEPFFDGLGDESEPPGGLRDALARDFGSYERWRAEFIAMGKALGGGSGWVLLTWSPRDRKLVTNGPRTIAIRWPGRRPFWRSICTSTPTTSISVRKPRAMSKLSCRRSVGTMRDACLANWRANGGEPAAGKAPVNKGDRYASSLTQSGHTRAKPCGHRCPSLFRGIHRRGGEHAVVTARRKYVCTHDCRRPGAIVSA
jgi:hypothetical protein